MKIFFDVGANDGHDGITALMSGKYDKCYAFEIDKRMIPLIKKNTKHFGDKYVLTECAVSSYNGTATYKLLNKNDVGTINELNTDIITLSKRTNDFKIIEEYEVQTITLEDFCLTNKIPYIDYLHIDTEGSDFNVIKGLNTFISNVKEGILECYSNDQRNLYATSDNLMQDCMEYLVSFGFKCSFQKKSIYNGNLRFKK